MLDARTLRDFEAALVTRAGGYLRNPIREANRTCATCTTPTGVYQRCIPCRNHVIASGPRLADAVAPLTYAVRGTQSGYMMRGYKAPQPVRDHVPVVSMLTWVGLALHTRCVGIHLGVPVTHWATVPSLPPKRGEHPFHRIVSISPPTNREAHLVAGSDVTAPRDAAAHHFQTATLFPPESHVLVVDDTWTTGGHAQSAALTLRKAGAAKVSVLVAARWINLGFQDNEQFLRRLTADYDPRVCPWTGEHCP